jgi:hypothetical protein
MRSPRAFDRDVLLSGISVKRVLKVDTAPLSLLTLIRVGQSLPLTYSLDYLIRSFNEDNFRGELQETRGEQHGFTGRQRDGAIR